MTTFYRPGLGVKGAMATIGPRNESNIQPPPSSGHTILNTEVFFCFYFL